MADEEVKNEALTPASEEGPLSSPTANQNQPTNEPSIADVLRIEGIKCKGYGIIPKAVTTDRDLSTNAIAIYAYFRSLSGKGDSVFPSRNRILNDIQISKDSYYKGLNELTNGGYIVISREKHGGYCGFHKNVYTITARPKKYANVPSNATAKDQAKYDSIMLLGLESLGYGIIPYAFMSDTRLKATPKAVYAYLSSFSGAQGYAELSASLIQRDLKMGDNALQRHIHQLRLFNYITTTRLHIDGKLAKTRYVIIETPDVQISQTAIKVQTITPPTILPPQKQDMILGDTYALPPQKQDMILGDTYALPPQKQDMNLGDTYALPPQKQDMNLGDTYALPPQKQDMILGDTDVLPPHFQDMNFQDMNFQDMKKQDTIINSSTSNSITINSPNINSVMMDRLMAGIRRKIEYSLLELSYGTPQEKAALDALVNVVVETLLSQNPRIEISGTVWLPTYVKDTLLTINGMAVGNVMERYLARADKVDNPKKYLLVAIFNELRSPTHMENASEC